MTSKDANILNESTFKLFFNTGSKRIDIFVLIFLFIIASLISFVLVISNGNVLAAAMIPVVLVVVLVTAYRLDWGYYIFIGMVLLFDQFQIRGLDDSFTYKVSYFLNINAISYLPTVKQAVVTPMELHLFLLLSIWLLTLAVKKKYELISIPFWPIPVLLVLWVIGSVIYGNLTGGDFVAALWEVRGIFYLSIMYFFTPQIIRSTEQLQTLISVCIVAISFKAFQGLLRFVLFDLNFGGLEELTNSEDPVFIVTILMLFIGLVLFNVRHKHRLLLSFLFVPLVAGMYVGQRRATFASFTLALFSMLFILPKKERSILLKVLAVGLVFFGIYLSLYWNTYGRIGMIAQQFKSIVSSDPEMAGMNYYSNLYREYENYNLAKTIQRAPIIGVGFGNKYDVILHWFGIMDVVSLLAYIPHNSILWMIAKTGTVGFFIFLLFMNVLIFRIAAVFKSLTDPYIKVVAIFCMLAIINQFVVSYVEMQFTYYRNMTYLGMLTGLLPLLERYIPNNKHTPTPIQY